MLHKNIIAVDAEINRLLQPAFCDHDVIQCMSLPAIMAQNMHIQQHPVIQTELSSGNSGEFGLHFVDLTSCQKTAASQIDAKDRLCIPERQVCLMQNCAITADGQDHI